VNGHSGWYRKDVDGDAVGAPGVVGPPGAVGTPGVEVGAIAVVLLTGNGSAG
jgi:hypothetical protein